MGEKLKTMAVVCHPADSIDHAGGTLCLHSERGDDVTVVVCTHGVDSHHHRRNERVQGNETPTAKSEAVEEKERETIEGLSKLGISDVRFLRLEDQLVIKNVDLIEAIAEQLADIRPHLLITHNPTEELESPHSTTARATLKACELAKTPRFTGESTGHDFPIQTFFSTMYGHTNQLTHEGRRNGNVLIDITPVVDRKVHAMDCLESQYYPGDLARKCIETINGREGLHARLNYAESFQTLEPHVHEHLPANEYLMTSATESRAERDTRVSIDVADVPNERDG